MKKILGVMLACILLLSFAGCKAEEVSTQDNSLTLVKDAGKLVIGLDDTFAPMGFREADGTLVGFDIDLAREVCAAMGVEAVFQPIDWDAKELELNNNKIDCIWNGMSITPERQESMSLTRGYLDNKIIIMSTSDVTISSKEDLVNYNLGTQAKSSALEVIKGDEIFPQIEDKLSEYPSYDDVIMDMAAGRIDVMIVDEVLGQYKNTIIDNAFNVAPVNFGEDLYAVGLRKGDAELTKALQTAMDEVVASGKAAEISEKWFGKNVVLAPEG